MNHKHFIYRYLKLARLYVHSIDMLHTAEYKCNTPYSECYEYRITCFVKSELTMCRTGKETFARKFDRISQTARLRIGKDCFKFLLRLFV